MRKVFINPPDLSNWEQTVSQIVVVQGGAIGTVYIAGQVSVDKEKNLIGGGDLSAQAIQAFQNLESALRAVGAAPSKITILKHRRFCKIPCESSAAYRLVQPEPIQLVSHSQDSNARYDFPARLTQPLDVAIFLLTFMARIQR